MSSRGGSDFPGKLDSELGNPGRVRKKSLGARKEKDIARNGLVQGKKYGKEGTKSNV